MGAACGMHGIEDKCTLSFDVENGSKSHCLEELNLKDSVTSYRYFRRT